MGGLWQWLGYDEAYYPTTDQITASSHRLITVVRQKDPQVRAEWLQVTTRTSSWPGNLMNSTGHSDHHKMLASSTSSWNILYSDQRLKLANILLNVSARGRELTWSLYIACARRSRKEHLHRYVKRLRSWIRISEKDGSTTINNTL